MKNLWNKIGRIKFLLESHNSIVFFLDFDGTLSQITPDPKKAVLDNNIESILKKLSSFNRVKIIVISGRKLSDIKKRVPIPHVDFAANHGMEWSIEGKTNRIPVSIKVKHVLNTLIRVLSRLKERFPGIMIENKGITISVHYRNLKVSLKDEFIEKFNLLVSGYKGFRSIEVVPGKKVFDLRPAVNWTKGDLALMYLNKFKSKSDKPLVIGVGDDTTDEDMFEKLKNAITIRVGKKQDSKSQYHVSNITQLAEFLEYIRASLI